MFLLSFYGTLCVTEPSLLLVALQVFLAFHGAPVFDGFSCFLQFGLLSMALPDFYCCLCFLWLSQLSMALQMLYTSRSFLRRLFRYMEFRH